MPKPAKQQTLEISLHPPEPAAGKYTAGQWW